MIHPTISPHDPAVVVEGCDMTGMYITLDGARSWRMFNLRSVLRAVAFDPADADVIYAGSSGLWRSEDLGKSWRLVFPDPDRGTVEHMRGDHADHSFTSNDPVFPGGYVTAIVIDPSDSKTIYIAMGPGANVGIYRSRDRGKNWELVDSRGNEAPLGLYVDAKRKQVLVLTAAGVRKLGQDPFTTEGLRFRTATAGETASGSMLIYATSGASAWKDRAFQGGIWVSEDGGRSWIDRTSSLLDLHQGKQPQHAPMFEAIACSLHQSEIAYVGFRGLKLDAGPPYNGVARTTNGGRHWSIVKKEANLPAKNSQVSWVEGRAAEVWKQLNREDYSVWFDAPRDLGVAPSDPDVCYATDLFRTCRTLDGGKSWETVNSVSVEEEGDRWTTRGLDVTTSYGVHFDPFDPKRIYISYTDIGLFRSEDGGRSWIGSTKGIPMEWRNTTYWIEMDPQVKGLIWGAFGANHDLPRPKMWRNTDPAHYKGGVATSTDGGITWTITDQGINETDITHIIMDPTSPVGRRTLYACGFGDGVFKSTDNGRTWALKRKGIEGRQPFAWRLARADDGTLYLVVARRSSRGEIGDENDGALYRSKDGAQTWEPITLPKGTNGPNGLTLDPRDNRRMYLSAWGRITPEGDSGGGIFLSDDAGRTWKAVLEADQHIYDVSVDPRRPDTLYACGFESAAYRSADRGLSWTRIRGYNFKWGHRVFPDPHNPEKIYITTFGGSVWHGPAQGDPNALEDVATATPKKP
jgi:photosystem II stability/assembly factor-like uncharacterized protein